MVAAIILLFVCFFLLLGFAWLKVWLWGVKRIEKSNASESAKMMYYYRLAKGNKN